MVQFANVTSFSLKAAEYLQGAETSVKVQLVAEHHLQKQALSSKQRRLWDPGWDWHGEAAAGTGRGGTSGGTAVLVRRHVDHRPGAVFQGLFCASSSGTWRCLVLESRQSESCFSNVDVLHELAAASRVLSCPFQIGMLSQKTWFG